MRVEQLFTQALALVEPWKVVSSELDLESKTLTLEIDFTRGARFPDPDSDSGELCTVHDTVKRKWQHLNFFQYHTIITARVPRITTPSGAVLTVQVPWAVKNSGFTLLMEAYLLMMAKVLPIREIERQTGVSDDRIWHLINSRVDEAWEEASWEGLERLGVDETSTRKGHKYGTAFMELTNEQREGESETCHVARLLFFTPGKGKDTFKEFVAELQRRQISPEAIQEVAMDMSPSFIAGAGEHFPKASLCFDRFHVMKLCGEAIEKVRKQVARECGGLGKGALWALRGNVERLSEKQRRLRESICREHRSIARALSLRDFLADLWRYTCREDAESHFESVLSWCRRSRLQPFVELGRSLKRHKEGILGYYKNYTTSAAIEALNGLLQLARRRARGYRCFRNFRSIAYWIAGRLVLRNNIAFTH